MPKYVNKVVYGSDVLIDLTSDNVTQSDVLAGRTFHAPNGAQLTGTCAYDVDSSSATANASEVISGKTFAKNGQIVTGTMANQGGFVGTIATKADTITIPLGYHDGSGSVTISQAEKDKIIAGNIREGIQILGVTGVFTGGENIRATAANVTPMVTSQTILPTDFGEQYQYISQVNVAAIPKVEVENIAGGLTVTIGAA